MKLSLSKAKSTDNEKYGPGSVATSGNGNQQELGVANNDSLPPKDGGSGAWLFLFGACVFEIVSWGKFHSSHTVQRTSVLITTGKRLPLLMGRFSSIPVYKRAF